MEKRQVYIIGGGASGMLAALAAASSGSRVTILERNLKLGKKILATGNGRCNFTNINAQPEDYNHPSFVKPVFEQFGVDKTIDFFERIGIYPKIEDFGKTYPLSEQALSINLLLAKEILHKSIEVIYDAPVEKIVKSNLQFTIHTKDSTYVADRIILACGGMALPQSGSDGSGYALAQGFGHSIIKPLPSLTKLVLDNPHLKKMDGVKFPGKVRLYIDKQFNREEESDVLFTNYGISGPGVLQLSRAANHARNMEKEVIITVALISHIDRYQTINQMKRMRDHTIQTLLTGLIHQKLMMPLAKSCAIDLNQCVKDLSKAETNCLLEHLFEWPFPVIGSKGFEDAQVTIGGINTKEIHPFTLESKRTKGLYFSGEIIDIDALCGGYNLQWAWSSGYVAGWHASHD